MSDTAPSASHWRAFFEQSPFACAVLNTTTWESVAASERYLALLGAERKDVVGLRFSDRPCGQSIGLNGATGLTDLLERAVRLRVQVRAKASDGTLSWVHKVTPITLGSERDVPYVIHTLEIGDATGDRDLEQTSEQLLHQIALNIKTEFALKESEEQLRQAQRLDALGRLAGGIAHDFNNVLSVVLGYSATLLTSSALDAQSEAQVSEIRMAGERAARLTRQLLAFSRGQMLEMRIVNLNALLTDAHSMLTRVLGEDVELHVQRSSRLGNIRVDPGQIEQVILNLAINARDAMPTGGRLTIETFNIDLDATVARDHLGTQPGPYVMLSVTDTGCGMNKATQARVFDPFFTTKEAGKGTGLGLSTVFGIVKQSGGSLWLYSEPNRGTCFKIYFPRVDEAESAQSEPSTGHALGGRELVLIVEDDDAVRQVAGAVLREAGYRVLETKSSEEARDLLQHSTLAFDLLLTDVIMPRMSGRVLAELAVTDRPALKVLFMSGYNDDAVVRHGVAAGSSFLQKPLTAATLTRKVREVLDGRNNTLL